MFISVVLWILLSGKSQSQVNFNSDVDNSISKETVFSIEELQEDFLQFRDTLENEHCCLYEYTDKETFDQLFDHQYSMIGQPMQLYEFFKNLTPVTAKIGCGHTVVWMPATYWETDPENLFLLQITLIEGYAVVSGSYNDTAQVPPGSIVQEINETYKDFLAGKDKYMQTAFQLIDERSKIGLY